MSGNQRLLDEILAFCAATDMAETTFGQKAVHEWSLVERLRDGRDVSLRTADRVREFIRDNSKTLNGKRRRSRAA